MTKCPDCKGSGIVSLLTSTKPCRRCQGTGDADALVYYESIPHFSAGPDGVYRCTGMLVARVTKANGSWKREQLTD